MPKLSYSSEKWGCGATIELDNKDVVIVSIDKGEVLVRQSDTHEGLLKAITRNRSGPTLYKSKNRYKNAKTAEALDLMFPQKVPALSFNNPVLSAFAKAIWHSESPNGVSKTLKTCEQPEQFSSDWELSQDGSFYINALRLDWRKYFIERGAARYMAIYSDNKKTKIILMRDEVTTWPVKSNDEFEAAGKPYWLVRLEDLDGATVWEKGRSE